MAKYLDETGLQRVVDKTKALVCVQELAVPSTGLRIQGMDDGVYKLTTTNVSITIYYDGLSNTTNNIAIYGNGTAGLLTVTKYGAFTYWRIWAKNYQANNDFEGLFYGSTTANGQTTFGVKKIDTLVNSASSLGSASKPVYVSSGELTEGTNYAGGTAVTLNGTDKSGSTASLYAPTSAGTSGYFLKSNGSGAPTWASVSQNIVPFPTGNNSQFLRYKGTLTGMAWEQPDTTPTSASVKVVTSGGVYTALQGKQDTLTFDSAPTNGSSNPVTSGGVYTAIQNAISALGIKFKDIGSGGNFRNRYIICVGGVGIFYGWTQDFADSTEPWFAYGVTFTDVPYPVSTFKSRGADQYADGKIIYNNNTTGFNMRNISNSTTSAYVIAIGRIDVTTIN